MSYNADLNSELKLDPAGLNYAPLLAANNDEAVEALINSSTVQVVGTITRDDLASWAAISQMHGKIVDFSSTANHPLRDSALSILSVLNGGASGGIDLKKPENMAILDNWEAAGELSAENKASFIAYATKPVARSIALFGRLQTANDIAWSVRDATGNSLLGA